jgi:FixJ family two-component response regulator
MLPLSGAAENGVVTSNAKPRVVIVDDDESVYRAIKRLVRSLGMDAETFTSGQEFISVLETTPSFDVDCVVLDLTFSKSSICSGWR